MNGHLCVMVNMLTKTIQTRHSKELNKISKHSQKITKTYKEITLDISIY